MNATSLYVSVCKLVLQSALDDTNCVTDLVRLLPYLRQSLSCTVCSQLLVQPFTPSDSNCQHHVCKNCMGGKKKLKPTCGWCKNYDQYEENVQLRILLQCYKQLCEYILHSNFYRMMSKNAVEANVTDVIDEAVAFNDDFQSNLGLTKSAYSILPCVYSATVGSQQEQSIITDDEGLLKNSTPSNGPSMYSVMYAGTGNKMVIKRKTVLKADTKVLGKRSPHRRSAGGIRRSRAARTEDKLNSDKKSRYGCRCGNATVTPGRLTCDGQRCPCYVVSKPCVNCKCRGCRNPITLDGEKILRDVLDGRVDSETTQEDAMLKDMQHLPGIVDDLGNLDQVLHPDLDLL